MNIYRSFEQWKNGGFLEHGAPRTEEYTAEELHLVEMGWNYGYDAGRAVEQALDKKAENARELGLSYDDEPKIGCVNHDCDKCKAVQEPLGYLEIDDIESQREYPHNCRNVNLWHEGGEGMTAIYIAPPAAQPVPVKTYSGGKPWPVQPKPWVGLTETEVEAYDSWADFQVGCGRQTLFDMVRNIEAKLKEKNT